MSRLGKTPVPVPDGVTAALDGDVLRVQGPKGHSDLTVHPLIQVTLDDAARHVSVSPKDLEGLSPQQARTQRAMWGTTRQLIANLFVGVTQGYTREVQVVGVGYSTRIDGQNLILRCGSANEVVLPIPDGVSVDPPRQDSLMVTGVGMVPCTALAFHSVDKQQVGQFAAVVRGVRPPEPYKGKGIRYVGEEVKRKAGKALAAGTT